MIKQCGWCLCIWIESQDRETQLERVFSLFCDLEKPAILMGDLNTFRDDPLLAGWLEDPEIHDVIGETLGEKDFPRRIDWIFTRGLTAVAAGLCRERCLRPSARVGGIEMARPGAETLTFFQLQRPHMRIGFSVRNGILMSVSVVVPIYNELENLPLLHAALTDVLGKLGRAVRNHSRR